MFIYHIHIIGLVQGVGFRPFIYRIANEMKLSGEVRNNNEGVCIEIEATEEQKELFINRIYNEKPIASHIDSIHVTKEDRQPYRNEFVISPSSSISERITHVSPDIAVCDECLKEMKTQPNRLSYPFINCTHCGPRFTIIQKLPYDRCQTSMRPYTMCPTCHSEYVEVTDRRFHAQPTACNDCGPYYYITRQNEKGAIEHQHTAPEQFFTQIANHIDEGNLLSMKGLGGYNLICNAFNKEAVLKMRALKKRDAKPFALMFRSLEEASNYLYINDTEKESLTSWQRPIVLLRQKPSETPLCEAINSGLKTIGVVLPYLPAHHLLFEQLKTEAIVFTSGNLHDEPIVIDNEEATQKLLPHCLLQGDHDRGIVNRADDSIIQIINNSSRLMRRSRGYVPATHRSSLYMEGILAFGPEKVNTFAIGKGNEVIMSQYIGDLKTHETLNFYQESIDRFSELFRFNPDTLVCDMHPDYFSTRKAQQMAAERQLPLIQVQHHHAHAVACMEEHQLSGNHLAIVLDGTGYGSDGKIWGGEFLFCNHQQFTREAHFDYIPLPGGDKVVKEPWRTAISLLDHYNVEIPQHLQQYAEDKIELIRKMIAQRINSPESSSAGRLFDAVSALLGCYSTSFQAEAPLKLEQLATDNYTLRYPIDELNPLNCCYMLNKIGEDLRRDVDKGLIAAKFHNTLVAQIIQQIHLIYEKHHLPRQIILTGGCFQNQRLSTQLENELIKKGFEPIVPIAYPANDGGVALGQIAIAATLRKGEYA